MALINCPECNKEISDEARSCPNCHSSNCKKIGAVSRAVSVGVMGLASSKIGKQWHCNSCGSNF